MRERNLNASDNCFKKQPHRYKNFWNMAIFELWGPELKLKRH